MQKVKVKGYLVQNMSENKQTEPNVLPSVLTQMVISAKQSWLHQCQIPCLTQMSEIANRNPEVREVQQNPI